MFPNSTILGPVFWIVMGLLYALIILSANYWAKDLKLNMKWWKWLLLSFWYAGLSISIAGSFTLFGEGENRAGYYFLGISIVIFLILGVGLWRLIIPAKEK